MPNPDKPGLKPLHCLDWTLCHLSTVAVKRAWAGGRIPARARGRECPRIPHELYIKGWTLWTVGQFQNSKGQQ